MPQFPNARISFGDILQAIEDQLVNDRVAENRAQIVWGTPREVPQFTAPMDILLIARNATHVSYDGGAADLRVHRMVDIWVRTESIADPGGGFKADLKQMFATGDQILDSVGNDNFCPEDMDGNLLTIESVKFVGDNAPDYPKPGSVFGDFVCTLLCIYYPNIDPSKGP